MTLLPPQRPLCQLEEIAAKGARFVKGQTGRPGRIGTPGCYGTNHIISPGSLEDFWGFSSFLTKNFSSLLPSEKGKQKIKIKVNKHINIIIIIIQSLLARLSLR